MPECPHCREYYFGNPDQCPKCYYDFKMRVVHKPQAVVEREEWKVKQEIERKQQAIEQAKRSNDERAMAVLRSARYEYATEYLRDSRNGLLNKSTLDDILFRYASEGWRLHSVFTNEAGKNASAIGIGGVTAGSNATMDVTILIFERCIKLAE